ncbi:hypothetical protein C8J57DRAFT_1608111 [Mycena rebaudengoi]|nr:hypothetical protein C8J57DRAFT_1608111 [Mycena rebaudengoi]
MTMSTNTIAFPRITIVDIPSKGKGVVANEYIRRGTLIVSEKPRILLSVPTNATATMKESAIRLLASMSAEDKEFFLTFPSVSAHGSLGRFKHFTPCVGDNAWGLFPTVCRVNHSCYSPLGGPNAAYFWNIDTKEEDPWPLKCITCGQEIEVSYMENLANYKDPGAVLEQQYGFICSCKGCSGPASERESSTRRLLAYNNFVRELPWRFFGVEEPLNILDDIQRQMVIVCEEGYTGEVGARAHDAFELCGYCGDAASAKQWEAICRDCHGLYTGRNSREFEESAKLAANPKSYAAWGENGRRKLRGSSQQVLAYCSPTIELAGPPPSGSGVGSSLSASIQATHGEDTPSTIDPTRRSKGQKKKAKARAKKAAAQKKENSGEQIPR